MCQYSANDGVASDWHVTHLGMLVNSGAALTVAEMTNVERHGRISQAASGSTRTPARMHSRAWSRIATASAPARSACRSRTPAARARPTCPWSGASAAPARRIHGRRLRRRRSRSRKAGPSRGLWTLDDIERIGEAFVASTRRAVRIGFDAIELHMAHGYLLHSFVSPISNRRNDEYGGELAGRMRFPLRSRARCARWCQRGAAGRPHHRQRSSRAGSRPMTRSCSRALKEIGLDYRVCPPAASVATRNRGRRLQRGVRREGEARGRHRHARGRADRHA